MDEIYYIISWKTCGELDRVSASDLKWLDPREIVILGEDREYDLEDEDE